MFYFDAGLFVQRLNEAAGREEDPNEKLKKIVLMVLEDNIDYASFTFEELEDVLEHVFKYEGSHDSDFKNLLVQMDRPAMLCKGLGSLKRRRVGHVFV